MLYVLTLVLSFFGSLLPKKGYIVFGAWFGHRYSDNPKYFFEYLVHSNEFKQKEKLVWITADVRIKKYLEKNGYTVALSGTRASVHYISRASFIVTCCGSIDVGMPLFTRATFIELWHGVALKKIGFDAYDSTTQKFKYVKRLLGRITSLYHPTFYNKNAFILSPSDYTDTIHLSAFHKSPHQLLRYDQPRYDILRRRVPHCNSTIKVAYLPTHRTEDGIISIKALLIELLMMSPLLEKFNIEVFVKMHYYNLDAVSDIVNKNTGKKIKFINADDRFFDLYRFLSVTDVLVTDYSSIYFDFMITGRPVIALVNDLDVYKEKERDLYIDYEIFAFNGYLQSWKEVIDIISSNDLQMFSEKNTKYVQLRERMAGGMRGNMSLLQNLVQTK